MWQINRYEYVDAVLSEIRNIRQHATELERDELRFSRLMPRSQGLCIYGLMTGSCYSPRATELIKMCADQHLSYWSLEMAFWGNGGKEPPRRHITPTNSVSFTALEHFIVRYPVYNQQIINYLNGQSYDLPDRVGIVEHMWTKKPEL